MPDKQPKATDDQVERVREVLTDTAQMQLAAVNAGVAFWSEWVEIATKFSGEVTRELANIAAGKQSSDEYFGVVTDLSRQLLREMGELPSRATARFNADLERFSGPTRGGAATRKSRPKAARRARAKA